MSDEKPNPFALIKHRGEPNKAEFEGVIVSRQEKLYSNEWGMVRCTPYDNHFIFEVPQNRRHYSENVRDQKGNILHYKGEAIERSDFICTCGSPAVITLSGEARMWVCLFYHSRLVETGHGYHATAVINKDDFENIAGQTIELPKGKQWLI